MGDPCGMCRMCSAADQMAHDVILDALEREIRLAEDEAGLTPEWASRSLSAAERRAAVRFGEIVDLEEGFLESVTPILEALHEAALGAVLEAFRSLGGVVDPRAFLEALEGLVAARPEAVAVAVDEATPGIAGALAATYAGAGAVALREARRQGVDADLPAPDADPGRFTTVARNAALEPYRRILTGVQDKVATPANLAGPLRVDDLLPMALSEIGIDSAVDQARQANHQAIGSGRMDTMERLPAADYYASEILDGNQCEACAAVDGRDYGSLEEARRDYPNGPMVRCAGGSRCRGTLIAVYRDV